MIKGRRLLYIKICTEKSVDETKKWKLLIAEDIRLFKPYLVLKNIFLSKYNLKHNINYHVDNVRINKLISK